MALLVLIYFNFKFFSTVPCLAFNENATARSILNILNFLSMSAKWTLYFSFFNFDLPPAIVINACFICSRNASLSFMLTFAAVLFRHSHRILLCSGVKCFSISSSSSVRIDTIRARTVFGPSPASICLNSSQGIVLTSLESRIPYSDWKDATIRS